MKDAPRSRARLAIGRRKGVGDYERIRRRGRRYLRNEDRDAGAAHAPSAVLRAGIAGGAARVLDAIIGDDRGKQICALHGKSRKPNGEEQPDHVPTIAREVPDHSVLDGLGMRTLGFVRRVELNRRMADSEALLQVVAQFV